MRSHARQSSVPPASAAPSTAAMIGLVRCRATNPAKPPRSCGADPCRPLWISLRSAPAQNTGGVAVSTPTHKRWVVLDPIDRRLESLRDVGVDRVARLGSIDRDNSDVADGREVDRWTGHVMVGRAGLGLGLGHRGGILIAPSRRRVSPLMYEFSRTETAMCA